MPGMFTPFSRLKPRPIAPPVAPLDIFKQGIYIKPPQNHPHWEAMFNMGYGTNSRISWDARLDEIRNVPNFRGMQVTVSWGLYEKGVNGGDFSNLDFLVNIADEFKTMGKYLILMLGNFREFRNDNVAKDLPLLDQLRYLLPPDLAKLNSGFYTDPDPLGPSHYLFDYAYAYDKFHNGNFGYNLKLYDATLRNRMQAFYSAVADRLGNHPAVICITSVESIVGTAVTTQAGGFNSTERIMYDNKTIVMDMIKSLFPNKMVSQDVNVPNNDTIDYVSEWCGQLLNKHYSLTTSNCGWWSTGLNRNFNLSLPAGILRYFSVFAGQAPLFVQWQGDEFASGTGGVDSPDPISSTAAYRQRYADLYLRTLGGNNAEKYGLFGNFIIIQRDNPMPIWLGGNFTTTAASHPTVTLGTVINVPSLRDWLQDPANVPQNGTAGLVTGYNGYIV